MTRIRILLTGRTGQVGYELERSLQGLGEIIAPRRDQMDLSNLAQVRDTIRIVKPNLIINAAAYTSVDKAENEPQLVMRINSDATGLMAAEAKKLGAMMIHYSTDYVFDGTKNTPYVESDSTCPVNVYGTSKRAGEKAIQAVGIPHLILRTSWVYGLRRHNFLRTILQQAQKRKELRIIDEQYGSPTWCRTIADITAHVVAQGCSARVEQEWWFQRTGTYHLSAQGQTTWYGFAKEILSYIGITKYPVLFPIRIKDYPLPAKRPINSVLNTDYFQQTFCDIPQWQEALWLCLGK